MNAIIDTLNEKEKKLIKYKSSTRKFKFGDATVYESIHAVLIPAVISSKRIMIEADVIETEIPLLLSKGAMKKAETVIHFKEDRVTMFGRKVKLFYTTTGHYCIALNKNVKLAHEKESIGKIYFVNINKIHECTTERKKSFAVKIHKQFGHATGHRLKKLFIDAGVSDEMMLRLIEDVSDKCDICIRYRKPLPKPIVTMPKAKQFNDINGY